MDWNAVANIRIEGHCGSVARHRAAVTYAARSILLLDDPLLPTAVTAGGRGFSLGSRCRLDGTANSKPLAGVRRYQIKLKATFSSPAGLWALSRCAQT